MKKITEEFELGFIKTHSLETLYYKVKAKTNINLNQEQLMLLDQLYIDARYPGELGLLPNGKPTIQEAEGFYELAAEVLGMVKGICLR